MKHSTCQKVFSKNENIVFREETEFGLLFDIETGRTHKINPTATTIWRSIDSKRTVADIIDKVKEEYGDVDTVSADVLEFLVSLEKTGYIIEVLQ